MAHGTDDTIILDLGGTGPGIEGSEMGTIIRNTPMITAVLAEDLSVAFANDLFLDYVGVPTMAMARGVRTGNLFGCIHSEDTGQCGESVDCPRCGLRLAIHEALKGASSTGQTTLIRRTGESIQPQHIEIIAYRISWEGTPYVVIHLVRSGERLMREGLERLFLHDALNSISGIQGLAATLRKGGGPQDAKMLGVIESYARGLGEEIKFYRCLRDAEGGDPGPVRTDDVMEQVASLNTHLVDSRGKFVAFDTETCSLRLNTDARLLKRVLGNLVKNAIEAAPDQGYVLLSCQGDSESVTFSVYNDGAIPEALRSTIFEGGISSKGSGRGLGLYGVKLLTEQFLGGAVSFSSSEEAGTWFHVRFPVGDV